ncbi:MAG: DUF262 domain-containing protein [Candidatus Saccharimonadaceae bacterium]
MTITTVNFDPDKKRIEDILEGSLQLVIPRYQRTYAWPKEKADEFYDDFIKESAKAEDNLAFMGTILFAINEDNSLEVIDGQQRLITITIFLAALRDVLSNLIQTPDANIAANHIQNMITISSTFGSSYASKDKNKYKLQVGIEIENIFKEMIYSESDAIKEVRAKNHAEKLVLDAYQLFYSRLKETLNRPGISPEQRLRIADLVLSKINGIEYIDIRVTNKEVAYNLFESHNAKGVALAKTDLIKNYYFGRLGGTDSEKNKKMDEWDRLLEDLTDKTSNMLPDRFFYYLIQSYEGHFPSSKLYRRIKPQMEDYQSFFIKLKKNVKLMIELKNSNTDDRDVNRVLSALNEKLRVNQCFILLLCLHRNKDKLSPSIYKKIFALIEDFTYLYSGITKAPGNALEKIYSKHAEALESELSSFDKDISNVDKERIAGRFLKSLKDDLRSITPAYTIFLESFGELRYTNYANRMMIRYTFEKIEYHHSKGIVLLGDSFTLDHIVPQKKAKTGYYQSIGNLTPMAASSNSIKGANDVTLSDYYDINNFYSVQKLNQQLTANLQFDELSIKERINYLADYAYNEAFAATS